MSITTSKLKDKNLVIINTGERLDILTTERFRNALNDILRKKDYRIIINLENTNYIDSTGLGALVSKIALTRTNNGDIRLAAPKQTIIDLLELTHLNKILKCYDSLDAAIDSY
jgi:anti-sigma B factor antagonist